MRMSKKRRRIGIEEHGGRQPGAASDYQRVHRLIPFANCSLALMLISLAMAGVFPAIIAVAGVVSLAGNLAAIGVITWDSRRASRLTSRRNPRGA